MALMSETIARAAAGVIDDSTISTSSSLTKIGELAPTFIMPALVA
jgi:hypothetical protein